MRPVWSGPRDLEKEHAVSRWEIVFSIVFMFAIAAAVSLALADAALGATPRPITFIGGTA